MGICLGGSGGLGNSFERGRYELVRRLPKWPRLRSLGRPFGFGLMLPSLAILIRKFRDEVLGN